MLQTLTSSQAKPVSPPAILPTPNISYEQFLKKYDGCHAEWINGRVIKLMSASTKHQDIAGWLAAILRIFVEMYDLGRIYTAPANMYLNLVQRGREPDIMFVRQDRLNIVEAQNLAAPADLVIEVVSPESAARDRGPKYVEYETSGITEYWLIDPVRQQADFYRLGSDGYYHRVALTDGKFHSEVLAGFWLEVALLWQEPLPKVMQTLQQLGLN